MSTLSSDGDGGGKQLHEKMSGYERADYICALKHEPMNRYERNIISAARYMVATNKGWYTYVTQHSSGSTIWRFQNDTILVEGNPI